MMRRPGSVLGRGSLLPTVAAVLGPKADDEKGAAAEAPFNSVDVEPAATGVGAIRLLGGFGSIRLQVTGCGRHEGGQWRKRAA